MSSTQRRPMSAALKTPEVSPAALEFIRKGTPVSMTAQPQQATTAALVATPSEQVVVANHEPDELANQPVAPTQSRATAKKTAAPLGGNMVSMSTRAPEELVRALKRASFEREMNQQEPFTAAGNPRGGGNRVAAEEGTRLRVRFNSAAVFQVHCIHPRVSTSRFFRSEQRSDFCNPCFSKPRDEVKQLYRRAPSHSNEVVPA